MDFFVSEKMKTILRMIDDFVDKSQRRFYTLRVKNLETGEILPDVIADVRGQGLMIGLEFVSQRDAASQAERRLRSAHRCRTRRRPPSVGTACSWAYVSSFSPSRTERC